MSDLPSQKKIGSVNWINASMLLSILTLAAVGVFARHGWDSALLCKANEFQKTGGDPYLTESFSQFSGSRLSIPYLPVWIPILSAACALDSTWGQTLLLMACAGVLLRISTEFSSLSRERVVSVLLILFGGFAGSAWNLRTGNFGLLELFGFSLSYLLFKRGRETLSGALMGVTASLKLLPFLYLGVPLLLAGFDRYRGVLLAESRWISREYRSFAGGAIVGGVTMVLLSVFFDPVGSTTYGHSLWSTPRLEVQHTAWGEWLSDHNTPTPFLMVMNLFPQHWIEALGGGRFAVALLGMGVTIGYFASRLFTQSHSIRSGHVPSEKKVWILLILMFFLFPRIKPYGFTLLILPAVALLSQSARVLPISFLFWGIAAPQIHLLSLPFWNSLKSPTLAVVFFQNLQWISAALASGYLVRSLHSEQELQPATKKA